MKVYELLSFNMELIDKMYGAGIKIDDYRYLNLYAEYVRLKDQDLKVTYIVSHLSSRYLVSERQVYSIIGRMQREVSAANTVQL